MSPSPEPGPSSDLGDESALLADLRSGDQHAFERLVRSTSGRMLAVARRFARTEEDAQDVVQTAYLNAFRALDRFSGDARLSTWLHRIVVNTALMKIRSQKARPEETLDPLLPDYLEDGHHVEQFTGWQTPADVLAEQAETRALVRESVAELPPIYRAVLLLRDIEERSTQEVAEQLDLTPAAVKTRLHRARQALSTLLRRRFASNAVTLDPTGASN